MTVLPLHDDYSVFQKQPTPQLLIGCLTDFAYTLKGGALVKINILPRTVIGYVKEKAVI